jgi:hypothetical protein
MRMPANSSAVVAVVGALDHARPMANPQVVTQPTAVVGTPMAMARVARREVIVAVLVRFWVTTQMKPAAYRAVGNVGGLQLQPAPTWAAITAHRIVVPANLPARKWARVRLI